MTNEYSQYQSQVSTQQRAGDYYGRQYVPVPDTADESTQRRITPHSPTSIVKRAILTLEPAFILNIRAILYIKQYISRALLAVRRHPYFSVRLDRWLTDNAIARYLAYVDGVVGARLQRVIERRS